MICPNCGYISTKRKLTLTVDSSLIRKAKLKGLNISNITEEKLYEVLKND